MKPPRHLVAILLLILASVPTPSFSAEPRRTTVSIRGEHFLINGQPTYAGRVWRGHNIEGLLLNARMVQGIFDDLNPDTAKRWAYADTGRWDADRNTREFVAAMPEWHRHGLRCVVLNLQGGSPEGYSREQPWHNSAIEADGSLRPAYMDRLARILDRADELGMVVMLGVFYFGQDQRLADDDACRRAVTETVNWLAGRGYRNVLLEIANECDNGAYDRDILKAPRVTELIRLAQQRAATLGHPLPVSVSFNGGSVPRPEVVRQADFVLLHGNGVRDPARMVEMIRAVRATEGFTPKPVVNNEDDRPWRDAAQGWGPTGNNFVACVTNDVSWGYFDYREKDEGFDEGYQSVPVNWGISSERKRAFFHLLAEITGSPPAKTASRAQRVYFIGNSVTDTIRYDALAELAATRGVELVWGRHMIPGAPLEWLHGHPDDGFREEPFGGWKRALTEFAWDAVSLQPFDRHLRGRNGAGEEVGDVALIAKLARLAAEKNPGVQIHIYARWPRVTVGGKSVPFDKNDYDPKKPCSGNDLSRVDDYLARWEAPYTGGWDGSNETRDYFETLLREVRKETPFLRKPPLLVPVGHVLAELHRQMRAGEIPGWTSIHQFYKDGIHLNEPGSYAVACAYFAALLRRSPEGLPTAPHGRIAPELARTVQQTAWRIVREHPGAGVAEPKP